EHHADGADDFVQRGVVTPGAVLRDEFDERAAVTEIEYTEEPGDRRRQGPEAVGGFSEVRDVERQHHQADEAVDEDRDVPRADVPCDERDGAIRRSPHPGVESTVHRVSPRRLGDAVSAHATPRAARLVNRFAATAALLAVAAMARAAFSRTRTSSRIATISASR